MALANYLTIGPQDHVANEERLYRLVKRERGYTKLENGEWRPSSQAFLGGHKRRISVDRAKLCNNDPRHTQVEETDYVCRLVAVEVRSIDTVAKRTHKNEVIYRYEVRVDSTPKSENAAHADIYAYLKVATKGAFRQLKEKLAELAEWEEGFKPDS